MADAEEVEEREARFEQWWALQQLRSFTPLSAEEKSRAYNAFIYGIEWQEDRNES